MARAHHPLPFGAELMPNGQTRFRLWAPNAKQVALVMPDRSPAKLDLTATDGGWFEATTAVGAGTQYLFRIDDEIDVPDPAARSAPQGVTGPNVVIDPQAFDWRDDQWRGLPWHQAVLYELHVGTFTEQGTYSAIIPRLRDLAALGVNMIELLPVATFPGARGWGYDGVLHFAPHPAYGQPDELKQFIQAAHETGIGVILDVVYNHFGPEGNYLHRYANSFFTDRYRTPWGSAIDFESAAGRNVRDFFIHNALYWLNEYRFDGLRLDAVHAITDHSPQHFVDELAAALEAGPARARHVHLILENHDNQASRLQPCGARRLSNAQWNDDFHHIAHVLLTGERDGYYANYAERPIERLARVLTEGFAYQGEPYGESREARGERSDKLAVTSFIDFLQNHDQVGNRAFGDRLASLASEDRVRAGLAILLLSPHVPMLFMGEEYAARQPFLYFCDYQGDLAQAITNGRRSEFAGFTSFGDESARARIPDPNARDTFERSRLEWRDREASPHRERLSEVRQLLRVRAEHVVPRIPSMQPGSARQDIVGNRLSVSWPTAAGVLQLDANLADTACEHRAAAGGQLLYSTAAAPAERQLNAWEVRLAVIP